MSGFMAATLIGNSHNEDLTVHMKNVGSWGKPTSDTGWIQSPVDSDEVAPAPQLTMKPP
jgi:hypothetical protein